MRKRNRLPRREAMGAGMVSNVGSKLIGWGERLLAWIDRAPIDSSSADTSAPPYIGPDLLRCVSTIPTVHRCVMKKAMSKARVPLLIGTVSNSGEQKPFTGPGPKGSPQRLFATVNPNEGPASFRARGEAMLQLTGDWFTEVDFAKSSKPQELWLMQSPDVTIVKGQARRPLRYDYADPETKGVRPIEPESVFHTRLPNPADNWRGLSPLLSTLIFAWLEDQIARFNTEYFARGGVPPGWISFEQHVPNEDRPDLRTEIHNITQGRGNRKRIGVLWDGAKWVPSGQSPAEGEFISLLETSKEQICTAFGVPPMYVGDLREASYANAYEQKEMYWFDTIIPEMELYAQDLTGYLHKVYGDETLGAWFDYESVEAIQDLRLKRGQSLSELYRSGLLTRDEVRVEMGKPRSTGGDTFYQPQILVPTGVVAPAQSGRATAAHSKAWVDDPVRHAKRLERERDMESFVPEIEKMFVDLATRQEKRALAAIEKAGPARTKDDSFDLELAEEDFEAVLLQAYARVVPARGQSAMGEVVDDPDFLTTVPGVTKWMEETAGKEAKLIGETAKKQLAETIARANNEGLDVATEIQKLFELRRSEALRIAWTEVGTAFNFATNEGWRQSEVVSKREWLSSRDAFVRTIDAGDEFDHAAMDTVEASFDEDFVVPGKNQDEAIPYPGEGSAGNRINCRCTIIPVVDEDAKRARAARKAVPARLVPDFEALFGEAAVA